MITFTTPASVSGVAQEGQLLTALGEVDDPMATITYQWQENISGTWTDIPGATSQTYTVIEADEGNALRVVETATDGGTSATSTSAPTAAVTDITLGFHVWRIHRQHRAEGGEDPVRGQWVAQ